MSGGRWTLGTGLSRASTSLRCAPRLVAQFAAQDLPDVRFRQLVAKFDVARTLVARQMIATVRDHVVGRQRGILPHDEELDRLARFLVEDADGRALEHSGLHDDHALA